ncbi:MAG: 30S ribosomal protein S20 [Verrucomicrobiota bacterium]|nr:30S ribosomal protein S20 [Limisphaera sp.]MDW8382216.1 30S ribosomal protein S20 [Verrucomicrobiota bacterium]
MANTRSAARAARVNERRRLRNRAVKTRLRRLQKTYLSTIAAGNRQAAEEAFRAYVSAVDKAVQSGVIPLRRAARAKSRLSARLKTLARA